MTTRFALIAGVALALLVVALLWGPGLLQTLQGGMEGMRGLHGG
jgi:hypothetical protein